MATFQPILTLESSASQDVLRSRIVTLESNLNSTGIVRAAPSKSQEHVDTGFEIKNDGMLLYTLVLSFVQTGAAKALFDAIRTLFASSRDDSLKVSISINNRKISITADNLTAPERERIINTIEAELTSV